MKANRLSDTIKEYARKLSDEDVRYLHTRLTQRIGPDLAEAVELLQHHDDVDHWLSQAKNSTDFFDMIDVIDLGIQNEAKRRFSGHDKQEKYRS